jgi:hypothetical protein
MSQTREHAPGQGQREALEESEKKAAEKQPENFKDEATEDKLVEIGPDLTDAPIKGIDPPEKVGGA